MWILDFLVWSAGHLSLAPVFAEEIVTLIIAPSQGILVFLLNIDEDYDALAHLRQSSSGWHPQALG